MTKTATTQYFPSFSPSPDFKKPQPPNPPSNNTTLINQSRPPPEEADGRRVPRKGPAVVPRELPAGQRLQVVAREAVGLVGPLAVGGRAGPPGGGRVAAAGRVACARKGEGVDGLSGVVKTGRSHHDRVHTHLGPTGVDAQTTPPPPPNTYTHTHARNERKHDAPLSPIRMYSCTGSRARRAAVQSSPMGIQLQRTTAVVGYRARARSYSSLLFFIWGGELG